MIDEALGVLLPLVESRGEYKIACKSGCNACCVSFVRVTPAQAAFMARWLLEPEQAALLARFRAWVPRWREAIGPEVALIEEALARHGDLPPEGADRDRYLAATEDYARRRLMCPFNDEAGNCAVYPVRPMPCRTWNVIGTADNCGPDPKAPPIVMRHPHLSQTIIQAREVLDGAATRAGRNPGERALVNALEDALLEAERL